MSQPAGKETDSGQLAFWPGAAVARRVRGLLTSGDHAVLCEPFLFEAEPAVWVVAQWKLTPKLATDGWWFPHWWNGAGSRRWTGTGGDIPEEATRFPAAAAAAEALAVEQLGFLAEFACHGIAHYLAVTGCQCGTRCAPACNEHVAAACYGLVKACGHEPEPRVRPVGSPSGEVAGVGDRIVCTPLPAGIVTRAADLVLMTNNEADGAVAGRGRSRRLPGGRNPVTDRLPQSADYPACGCPWTPLPGFKPPEVIPSVCDRPRLWNATACIAHLPVDERAARYAARITPAQWIANVMAGDERPACWTWPVPDTLPLLADRETASLYLDDWHEFQCAICAGPAVVTDHAHETGLARGRLCRSCNTGEGKSDRLLYRRYRKRNPASILGIAVPYWSPFTGLAEPASPQPPHEVMRAVVDRRRLRQPGGPRFRE